MLNKIKIGAIEYNIEPTNNEGGEIDFRRKKIKIDLKCHKDLRAINLWHEILHGINSELKETEVEYLAQAIYQVLKENKLWRDPF